MKILVSCVPFDRGKSGISVYIRNLIAGLEKDGHELTLIVEPGVEEFFHGRKLIVLPKWTGKPLFSMFYHLFVLPFRLFSAKRWDFCVIAAANRRAFCFYPLFTVCVVHDLAQYHVASKYDRFRTCYLKTVLPFFVRRAGSVVAISRSTAADLVRFWKVKPEKITVCLNGLSLSEQKETGWAGRLSLGGGYILYVSRIEHPGKNHLNLIKAYEMLDESLRAEHPLVIAGADWHGAETVHRYALESMDPARIIFTGFIAASDLYDAYMHAACYVFPSYFEGFGLSLIEAMHYGIPCCCSDNSSLGEIGEGAALLFPPSEPEAIAVALTKILTDQPLRERLIEAGRKRAAMFSWSDHVAKIVGIYEKHRKK